MKRVYASVAFALVLLAAMPGGAGTGGAAATQLTVELAEIGAIGSISAGGTVGYKASVENTGPSTVAHVTFVVETALGSGSGAGTYLASEVAGPATCVPGASSVTCTAFQLAPGGKFTVNVAFSTPASAALDSLDVTAVATVSAQTQGATGNKGTSSWPATPVSTEVVAASDLSFRSFSLPDDNLATGVSLKTELDLPPAFANGHFGLVTGISEFSNPAIKLCDKCPTVFSSITIPASLDPDTNPFAASFDSELGTGPYLFVLTLAPSAQPPGYKVGGISHLAEGLDPNVRANWKSVPLCTPAMGFPADATICLDAPPSKDKKTGVITATGRGIENGWGGFD
jgi:hypothetical protein